MKMRLKIRWWLVASIFLFFVISFLVGLFFSIQLDKNTNRLLTIVNCQQADLVKDVKYFLMTWSKSIEQYGYLLTSPCDDQIIRIIDDDPRFTTYGVVTLDGNVVCTKNQQETNVSLGDRSYIQQAIATKQLSMSGFQIGRFTGKGVVAYAYPVFDNQGNVIKVVFLGVDLKWMNDFFEKLDLPKDSELILSDPQGVIEVYYPETNELIGEQMFNSKIFSIVLAQQEGKLRTKGIDGTRRKYIYGPIYLNDDETVDAFLLFGLPRWPDVDYNLF
ncbi:MAG: Sensor protein [uncultured bacterium]|nr:MAG: Sensor protein [uncultured bacterium]OGJ37702.1 MAG: hypothetical protein A2383_02275 [Candidatus Pacebacteria bacterium RIFOXYB1_FULL_39_46]OGJ39108.1 MAG: hypothetical protein A2182_02175 [Candidatus Pacebacteria bacterium RIFOXYA1_FULL_38_18]OGJ40192.1 MAG: hypothetical protein A2582_03830 [Candidatus Pacebacteria bacterium RIFOXYD1_FULL_39_27]OGJ41075.1 MAG: hypothetical protein A2411_01175 [Candidatus Pacebacteria bacterium RIFOXYC1_FULL_39_21]